MVTQTDKTDDPHTRCPKSFKKTSGTVKENEPRKDEVNIPRMSKY